MPPQFYHEAYRLPETPNSLEEFVEDVKEGRVKSFYIKVIFTDLRDDEDRDDVVARCTRTNITSFKNYMSLPKRESASVDPDTVRPPPARACRA
jgi:hypothetical protein